MKFLFRFYMIIFFSLFVFAYNAYALDGNYKNVSSAEPSNLCSNNSGSLDSSVTVTSGQNTFPYVDNFSYSFWRSWYKNDTNNNKDNYPYLMENNFENGNATLIYDYEKNDLDNSFVLKYKQFKCTCPYGIDTFGQCKEEIKATKDAVYANANAICSRDGKIAGATGVMYDNKDYYYRWGNNITSTTVKGREYTRNSDNSTVVNYLLKKSVPTNDLEFFYEYQQADYQYVQYGGDYHIKSYKVTCSCPNGAVGDEFGQCIPLNCQSPEVEVSSGICGTPDFCSDGGQKVGGFCDRSCESLGMITYIPPNDNFDVSNPEAGKRCVNKFPCDEIASSCILKCGGIDKVKNSPTCVDTIGTSGSCQCLLDEEDDIVDNEEPDENTSGGDSLLTNKYLKAIKDENIKQNEILDEIDSLLMTSNQNDLTRENQLNSIDGKLSNIDGSIQNMNNNIGQMKDNIDGVKSSVDGLKDGQDEGNGWLEDIWNKLVDIYTFYEDLQNEVLTGTTNAQSKLDNDLANLETVDDLDINNTVQSYLDSVASKYTNALGLSSSYGSRPSNITVTLFEKEYTIIDFSVLDEHITVVRNLFLTIAYLSGFMMLLRKV